MADYGIQTTPDGVGAVNARMAPTVPMSVEQAMAYMQTRQSDTYDQGSTIGESMEVPDPVSMCGNEPMDPDAAMDASGHEPMGTMDT
jgi:hypothetical protein